MKIEEYKRRAAEQAVLQVKSGMRLGLGTGSTTQYAVQAIGRMLAAGDLKNVVGVPTSLRTETLAQQLSIPLVSLDEAGELDLAIDGADEVDPNGQLIKGGGGALLREKQVELKAKRLVIVVDEGKLSSCLGTRFALPVEVVLGSATEEATFLSTLGAQAVLRGGNHQPFVTDNGNHIIDARFANGIENPHTLAQALEARANVREHGLFLDMANEVIVAGENNIRSLLFR